MGFKMDWSTSIFQFFDLFGGLEEEGTTNNAEEPLQFDGRRHCGAEVAVGRSGWNVFHTRSYLDNLLDDIQQPAQIAR